MYILRISTWYINHKYKKNMLIFYNMLIFNFFILTLSLFTTLDLVGTFIESEKRERGREGERKDHANNSTLVLNRYLLLCEYSSC